MLYLDRDAVSELHKDAHGVYPSSFWWRLWDEATDELKLEEWNDLFAIIEYRKIAKNNGEDE